MKLAINLASQRIGLTGTNPSVGCVIVKNNEIISTGQTGLNGTPHAEFNAIKNCNKNLKGSTIYISLEPCSHYGKTPPCTNQIIKSKIKKVVYSINDIDLRSSGKASKILNSKKINVKKFILKKEANILYKPYFFNKFNSIPFVTGKIAISKDNFISSKKKIITNHHSRKISHLLRYKNQGILISSDTLNSDNPKLTCRINGLEKFSPKIFILDKNLISKKKSFVIKNAKKNKTFIFYNKKNKNKLKFFKKAGINMVNFNLNKNNHFDLKKILKKINNLNVTYLLVEGGKKLTNNFLETDLFNQFYLFKSNLKLGSKGRVEVTQVINKLRNKFTYRKKINTYVDKDELIIYY